MKGLVSVVVPTWNRAAFIGATVESVLAQSHDDLELLICDDGSTDSTEEIVRAFDDPRVRWLPGPRAGRPAPPRNRGIRASRGDRIAFLDSDDRWTPDKLSVQLCAMDETGLKVCCSNAHRVVDGVQTGERFIYWNRPRITFRDLLTGNMIVNSSVVMDRDLIPAVSGFPEAPELTALEDYALWMRAATRTDFAFCDACLVYYRDDPVASVRERQLPIFESRRMVARDFEVWARETGLDARYLALLDRWYVHGLANAPAIAVNAIKKIWRTVFEPC